MYEADTDDDEAPSSIHDIEEEKEEEEEEDNVLIDEAQSITRLTHSSQSLSQPRARGGVSQERVTNIVENNTFDVSFVVRSQSMLFFNIFFLF